MFRYMAFCWNSLDPAASHAVARMSQQLQTSSSRWHSALHRQGLAVFHAGARTNVNDAYVLSPNHGVVLGKLFCRDDDNAAAALPVRLDGNDTSRMVDSRGRHLVDRYWGRYVAFLYDSATGATRVLRDPTGTLPCFVTRHEHVWVCYSWTEDAINLGLPTFSVNWDYVAVHLPSIVLESRETALNEVAQVLAGECVELLNDVTTSTFYWNPVDIARASIVENREVAATMLRSMVKKCVGSWASCYEGILTRLSGGLDSSIVLTCMIGSARPRVTCLNYFSAGSDSDERHYARLAAAAAACELVERERDSTCSLKGILKIARTPRPSFYLGYLENGRLEAELARARGSTAIFTGAGGDQIFYQSPAVWPAADYAVRYGLRPSLFTIALNAARLARTSVWAALWAAMREIAGHRTWTPQSEVGRFLKLTNSGIIEAARRDERFLHPVLKFAANMPPGRLEQIWSLVYPSEYYDPLGLEDDPECVHPLLSQPLVELCLRIPTYVLANGGWDRALARQAFADDLPAQIAWRRSKGGQEEHLKAMLLRDLNFVRALLLDGALVEQRLLDRKKLEEVLSGRPTAIASSMIELFTYLSIEAWLRRWCEARQQAVA